MATLLEENILKEEMGVNNDVKLLSQFLYDVLDNRAFPIGSTFTFTKSELPVTLSLNINELNIYHPNCEENFTNEFDLESSNQSDDGGYVINLALCEIEQNIIYHEINHVLQFILRGKIKSIAPP